jgi:hypothetical protein
MAKAPALDPKIEKILDEMKKLIEIGMSPKTFDTGVEEELRIAMRPKVKKRIDGGGDWESERDNPLICALHMGQIAKVLAKGSKVSKNVARAAFFAAQNDEHCTKGGVGGGDWCG